METCCGCFQTPAVRKKGTKQLKPEKQPSKVLSTEQTSQLINSVATSKYQGDVLRNSHLLKGGLWKSQFEAKNDGYREVLYQGNNGTRHVGSASMASHDGTERAHGGSTVYRSVPDQGLLNQKGNHQPRNTEYIQKVYRFQCPKCKKTFKKALTTEVPQNLTTLEDTINSSANTQCICPFCQHNSTNLLEVQAILAGYISDGGDDIKEEIDEEESEENFSNHSKGKFQVQVQETDISKRKDNTSKQIKKQQHKAARITTDQTHNLDASMNVNLSNNDINLSMKIDQEGANKRLQSPANIERPSTTNLIENNIDTSFKNITKQNVFKFKPIHGTQIQIIKDDVSAHAESEENGSQTTTKMSSQQIKTQNSIAAYQKKQNMASLLVQSKVEEETCRSYNTDVMRSLVARKMTKNKTYYELKFLPTQMASANILGQQTLQVPNSARYLNSNNRNTQQIQGDPRNRISGIPQKQQKNFAYEI